MCGDTQLVKERCKQRIIAVVVHNEARIDSCRDSVHRGIYRIGMPARIGARFENLNIMMGMQQMGCVQPCNASPYDRDTQTNSP